MEYNRIYRLLHTLLIPLRTPEEDRYLSDKEIKELATTSSFELSQEEGVYGAIIIERTLSHVRVEVFISKSEHELENFLS